MTKKVFDNECIVTGFFSLQLVKKGVVVNVKEMTQRLNKKIRLDQRHLSKERDALIKESGDRFLPQKRATNHPVVTDVKVADESINNSKEARQTCRYYDGLLLDEKELNKRKQTLAVTDERLSMIKLPAITGRWGFYTCQRCLNQDPTLFLSFSCGKCQKKCVYCLSCIKYGRLASCQSLFHIHVADRKETVLDTGFTFTSTLTIHQQKASRAIAKAMDTARSQLLVHAVCGAGKTEMLFHGINRALIKGKRVALTTPRQDVIKELLPRFQAVFTQVPLICQYGGSDDNRSVSVFTLCTTHQLVRYKEAFDVLIIDEVDAFPYHNDPALIKQSKRALKETGTVIYLTATPRKQLLKQKLKTCFVPVRYHGQPLPLPVAKFTSFKKSPLPSNVQSAIKEQRQSGRQLLLFVATIKQAEQLLPILREKFKSLKIEAVHATEADRSLFVKHFRDKAIDLLVTTTILERGVTFPSVDVFVLHADHDVFDEAALVQIAGRAGRSKDDPTGTVYFFHEGYTEAIKGAKRSIKRMNQLGET